jgi:DNA-binding transcriptional MerR regulator
MRIGELAKQAGVNVQTLRYYERRGLVRPPSRSASGFRQYDDDAVRGIRFIRRAQDLGFTLVEIRDLLALWPDSAKACALVERRAGATVDRIEAKITDLRRMKRALTQYVAACRDRAVLQECPLLAGLGGDRDGRT